MHASRARFSPRLGRPRHLPCLSSARARCGSHRAGGSPGFLFDLGELLVRHKVDAETQVSPGSWVYWDTGYARKMPGLFDFAALILAQVMDFPGEGLITLNLGYKRWGADQGPIEL